MKNVLNLVKLSVGTESVEGLAEWHGSGAARKHLGKLCHVTRMWPRRKDEILDCGGSIFWVIRGMILARQKISGFEPYDGADGVTRCAILLDDDLIRTVPLPRKAFQGWRYLAGADAPLDLGRGLSLDASLPPDLEQGLAQIGVLARPSK